MKWPQLWQSPHLPTNVVRSVRSRLQLMFDVLRVKTGSEMYSECNMFDVTVALKSCVICGVLSCGSVRSTRGIVAIIIIPHRDNLVHSPLTPISPMQLLQLGFSPALHMEIGMSTSDLAPRCGPGESLLFAVRILCGWLIMFS